MSDLFDGLGAGDENGLLGSRRDTCTRRLKARGLSRSGTAETK